MADEYMHLHISNQVCTRNIEKFNMASCKSMATPTETRIKLPASKDSKPLDATFIHAADREFDLPDYYHTKF
jgi:hypothetical protein